MAITLKSFSIKQLMVAFTIAVFISGYYTGNLIGQYQGINMLAEELVNRAITPEQELSRDSIFTLGSGEIYYLTQSYQPMGLFDSNLNESEVINLINQER